MERKLSEAQQLLSDAEHDAAMDDGPLGVAFFRRVRARTARWTCFVTLSAGDRSVKKTGRALDPGGDSGTSLFGAGGEKSADT